MTTSSTIKYSIIYNIDDIEPENISFCHPIKNSILQSGTFSRLVYSANNILFNGLHIFVPLKIIGCEPYHENKYKCTFQQSAELRLLTEKIKVIEEYMWQTFTNSIPEELKITNQLKGNTIRMFLNCVSPDQIYQCNTFILKISGFWEETGKKGITFRFMPFRGIAS